MSTPSFVNIDNDGDLDLLVGAEDAPLMQFFVNQGSNVFVADNGPIAGVTSVRDGHPHFVDLDRDGDYDLLIGVATVVCHSTKTPDRLCTCMDTQRCAGSGGDRPAECSPRMR